MSGDYSSKSFDALRDFAGVFMQQGHPTLDADWNELVAILERRLRAETVDIIGRAVVPLETPDGFRIALSVGAEGQTLQIGRGRMYVDGLLAENHGLIDEDNPPIFDRTRQSGGRPTGVLDELISREPGDQVDYSAQPYFPDPVPLPEGEGPHLAYLDVWKREVTPLKDTSLLDPALGGIDTATRWQTVWQVRLLEDVGANVSCAAQIPDWIETTAPSAARLTNGTVEFEDPDEPCIIPPGGGYRGLENQLYRVEIHVGSDLSDARFKWSRENASVGARVETVQAPDRLTVVRIGRDSVLRFQTGDWVEVTDDIREFHGLSGDMRRVTVDEDSRTLELSSGLSADLIPSGVDGDTLADRNTRVIRWDQSGQVVLSDGTDWEDLDDGASDGLIPVPADGSAVILEAGVTVSFSMEPEDGTLRPMDYWCFAARTAGAQIEPLVDAPPHGIHHHYARLAIVTFPETVVDCRIFWPPPFTEGEGCACTVCVSPESHNSGALTIQAAVDQLPAEGGTVCLEAGNYFLGATPVVIAGRNSVRMRGQGGSTILAYIGAGAALRIHDASDARMEEFSVVTAPPPPDEDGTTPALAGVHLLDVFRCSLRRLIVLALGDQAGRGHGIGQEGIQMLVRFDECLVAAPVAVGFWESDDGPGYVGLVENQIIDSVLMSQSEAISYSGMVLLAGSLDILRNAVSGQSGMVFTGLGTSAAPLSVRDNSVVVNGQGNGVAVGFPNSRIHNNEIVAQGDSPGVGILLRQGLLPEEVLDTQIVGNRIRAAGIGILLNTNLGSVMIKRNVVRECLSGGIIMGSEASVEHLAIDNNLIEDVAGTPTGQAFVGVSLSLASNAQVVGNTVRTVGQQTGQSPFSAGVVVRGVGELRLESNSIGEIGDSQSQPLAYGVLILAPFSTIAVSRNQIEGSVREESGFGAWTGIGISSQSQSAGLERFPVFFTFQETFYALSRSNLSVLAQFQLPESQVTVEGNRLADAHRGVHPMVNIGLLPASACLFVGNQCRHFGSGEAAELVHIISPRVVAANNVVRRDSEALAMRLVVGRGGQATVMGNLTFGEIDVVPNGIPAEMKPLNLLSQ